MVLTANTTAVSRVAHQRKPHTAHAGQLKHSRHNQQERKTCQLAEHTVVKRGLRRHQMVGMGLVAHTLNTQNIACCRRLMNVQGSKHHHRSKYRQKQSCYGFALVLTGCAEGCFESSLTLLLSPLFIFFKASTSSFKLLINSSR